MSTNNTLTVNDNTNSNYSSITSETKSRKVSILDDHHNAYDNPAFDHPSRKISQHSNYSEGEEKSIPPLRKKSILHNPLTPRQQAQQLSSLNNHNASHVTEPITHQPTNAPPYVPHLQMNDKHLDSVPSFQKRRRYSTTESLYSRHEKRNSSAGSSFERSWIYALCMRCRVKYDTPTWEPKYWSLICPYPLCPSYRQFARLFSIILIVALLWVAVYSIVGDTAAPGGQLFSLAVLTVASNFGGWLVGLTTLPRLIGMLLTGIIMQNIGAVNIEGEFVHVTAELRKIALVIILIRAGLEMDPEAFKKVWVTILKLGLVPWFVEASVVCVLTHYLLSLPWMWSLLLGCIIAAVSPAVVVPCLFRIRTKGYGVVKGIPTLIIAVAGIDDAVSVAGFGIIVSLMFSTGGVAFQISQGPVCILGGLGFGIIYGLLAQIIPEKGDSYVTPIRTMMLLGAGLMAVHGSELLDYEGAGPLAVVFAAFTSNYLWCKQGWSIEENPVSTSFEIFWMIFEPILFGVTGAAVKINELDAHLVTYGLIALSIGAVLRIITTTLISFGDKLNWKERIFVSLSWMAKATVQAALGPVALRHLAPDDPDRKYAEIVLNVCILAIVLTAPLGAILISITGTKLLTKTGVPHPEPEDWRRSHRPSLYDISIIEEEENKDHEDCDPEDIDIKPDSNTVQNTLKNAQSFGNLAQNSAFTAK